MKFNFKKPSIKKPKFDIKKPKFNFNTGIKFTNLSKPASIKMQQTWRNMPQTSKNVLKKLLPDSDRDGVPNGFDCQPFNPKKQDSKNGKSLKNYLNEKDINKIKQYLKDLKEDEVITINEEGVVKKATLYNDLWDILIHFDSILFKTDLKRELRDGEIIIINVDGEAQFAEIHVYGWENYVAYGVSLGNVNHFSLKEGA